MNELAILWFLRFKQLKSKLRFWLAAVGYNASDRSVTNRLYLIYILLFFSAWGLMVVALLSAVVSQYLFTKATITFPIQAGLINLLVFLAWFSASAYLYMSHSPMLFSEEDALLICQTPIRRNLITFVEFLFDWPFKFAPFFVIGVVLGFSALDANLTGPFAVTLFPEYLLSAVRAVTTLAPFHFGLYCFLWVIGLGRLQGKFTILVRISIGISLLVGICSGLLLFPLQRALINVNFFWPITFPVIVAYDTNLWVPGILLSLLYSLMGFFSLNQISRCLNLTNVQQAAGDESKRRILLQAGYTAASLDLVKQHTLGEERCSVSFAGKTGVKLLIQKDFVQSFRYIAAQDLIGWFLIPLLFYLSFQFADHMTRWVIIAYLIPVIAQKAIARMSDDLKLWWLFRSLPLAPETILIGNLAGSYFLVVVLLGISFCLAVFIHKVPWFFFLLIPFTVAIIFLAAAVDLFRQSKRELLSKGSIAGVSGFSVLASLFSLMIIIGVYWLASPLGLLAIVLAWVVAGIILAVSWKLAIQFFYSL